MKANTSLFQAKGDTQTDTFVLNSTTNKWVTNKEAYEITSNGGKKAEAKMQAAWSSSASQKEGVLGHITFNTTTSSSQAWYCIYIRGATSISWDLSDAINFRIRLWESMTGNETSICSGRYGPNDIECNTATGSFDFSEASSKVERIDVIFKGDLAGITDFDINSLSVTYSVENCLYSVETSNS